MTFTALLSVKDKTDLDVIAGGILDLPEENWQLVGGSKRTKGKLDEFGLASMSGYEFLRQSPLKDLAELFGEGEDHREERTQLLALLAQVNGKLAGWPEIHMVVGCPTPLKEKVKSANSDSGVGSQSDSSGLALLNNAMGSGCIVVPHHRFYRDVVNWLREGRPNSMAMRERLQAATSLTLGLHALDDYRFIEDYREAGTHA